VRQQRCVSLRLPAPRLVRAHRASARDLVVGPGPNVYLPERLQRRNRQGAARGSGAGVCAWTTVSWSGMNGLVVGFVG
jgi:hypothetical protein